MRSGAMLPEVECLPRTEREARVHYREGFAGPGEGGARVGGHVVRPLVIVLPVAALRHEIRHESGQVFQNAGIGVLLDDEARGGVLHEHRANPAANAAALDEGSDFACNVGETAAARADFERLLGDVHPRRYAMIRGNLPGI